MDRELEASVSASHVHSRRSSENGTIQKKNEDSATSTTPLPYITFLDDDVSVRINYIVLLVISQ